MMGCSIAEQDTIMRCLIYSVLIFFCVIAVPGCAPDQQTQQEAAVERPARKKRPPKQQPAAPVEQPQPAGQPFSYSSAGKADPFRPLIVDTAAKKASDARSRDRDFLTPLQKYELKDLKLVAVVVSEDGPTAMLEDPTGYGYVVRTGMLVGPNDGVVERVTRTGIIVREKIYNSLGEEEPRISTITIQHLE